MCPDSTCANRWNQLKTPPEDSKHYTIHSNTKGVCAGVHWQLFKLTCPLRSDGWSTAESLWRLRNTDAHNCPVQILSKYVSKRKWQYALLGDSCSAWREQVSQTIKASPPRLMAIHVISTGVKNNGNELNYNPDKKCFGHYVNDRQKTWGTGLLTVL